MGDTTSVLDTTGEITISDGSDTMAISGPSFSGVIYNSVDFVTIFDPEELKLSVSGDIRVDGRIEFDGVALTAQDVKDFKQHIKHHFNREADMWTAWNIFIVAVICIVVTKLVIPNLTVKTVAKFFAKVIYWPFKRAATKVETELNNAINEEEKNS